MKVSLEGTPLAALQPLVDRYGSFAEQLIRYCFVGGIAFVVDIASFVAMTEAGLPVLFSAGASFVVATLVNYALCYRFVFVRARYRRPEEVLRLFVVAGVGAALNVFFVWLLLEILPIPPLAAKIGAVPFVFGWNFLGRKLLVFHSHMPKHDHLYRPTEAEEEA